MKKGIIKILDTSGLKCNQPVMKIAATIPMMKPGDILEVIGDCPTFARDIRTWCKRLNKQILFMKEERNNRMKCQIQF